MINFPLTIGFILVASSTTLLLVLIAFHRREKALTVYTIGFLLGCIGIFVLLIQSIIPYALSLTLSTFLLIMFHISLSIGIRVHLKNEKPWHVRFSVYLAVWIPSAYITLLLQKSNVIFDILTSIFVIILVIEFIINTKAINYKKNKSCKISIILICSIYIIMHLVRIFLYVFMHAPNALLFDDNFISLFTLSFSIFFTVLWAGLILIIDDFILLSKLKEKTEELVALATIDQLTGIYNRRIFDENVQSEIYRSERYNTPLSIIMFDLDHFKDVNDIWGHLVGDEVLTRTAQVAKKIIRSTDIIARWGGEEFVILTPETNVDGAQSIAEKIRIALKNEEIRGVGSISASFGIAERMPKEPVDHWIRCVDQALYRAKNTGRNKVVVWNKDSVLPVVQVRIEWHDEWNSGSQIIDKEHHDILEKANELLDISLTTTTKEELLAYFDDLLNYISIHFNDEEKELEKIEYPDLTEHAYIHASLITQGFSLRSKFIRDEISPSDLFSYLVGKVVMGHLLSEDSKFFVYTKKK